MSHGYSKYHIFLTAFGLKRSHEKSGENDGRWCFYTVSDLTSQIIIIFIFTNNAEDKKFPLVLQKLVKKFVKWHFKLRQMAIGHCLKFFT